MNFSSGQKGVFFVSIFVEPSLWNTMYFNSFPFPLVLVCKKKYLLWINFRFKSWSFFCSTLLLKLLKRMWYFETCVWCGGLFLFQCLFWRINFGFVRNCEIFVFHYFRKSISRFLQASFQHLLYSKKMFTLLGSRHTRRFQSKYCYTKRYYKI